MFGYLALFRHFEKLKTTLFTTAKAQHNVDDSTCY